MGNRVFFGMSVRFLILLITPLVGAILGIAVALANPDSQGWGLLVTGLFIVIFFIQLILFTRSRAEFPIWTGFLVIWIVVLAVADKLNRIEDGNVMVGIVVFMLMMYGMMGLFGVFQWIGMGVKYLGDRFGANK